MDHQVPYHQASTNYEEGSPHHGVQHDHSASRYTSRCQYHHYHEQLDLNPNYCGASGSASSASSSDSYERHFTTTQAPPLKPYSSSVHVKQEEEDNNNNQLQDQQGPRIPSMRSAPHWQVVAANDHRNTNNNNKNTNLQPSPPLSSFTNNNMNYNQYNNNNYNQYDGNQVGPSLIPHSPPIPSHYKNSNLHLGYDTITYNNNQQQLSTVQIKREEQQLDDHRSSQHSVMNEEGYSARGDYLQLRSHSHPIPQLHSPNHRYQEQYEQFPQQRIYEPQQLHQDSSVHQQHQQLFPQLYQQNRQACFDSNNNNASPAAPPTVPFIRTGNNFCPPTLRNVNANPTVSSPSSSSSTPYIASTLASVSSIEKQKKCKTKPKVTWHHSHLQQEVVVQQKTTKVSEAPPAGAVAPTMTEIFFETPAPKHNVPVHNDPNVRYSLLVLPARPSRGNWTEFRELEEGEELYIVPGHKYKVKMLVQKLIPIQQAYGSNAQHTAPKIEELTSTLIMTSTSKSSTVSAAEGEENNSTNVYNKNADINNNGMYWNVDTLPTESYVIELVNAKTMTVVSNNLCVQPLVTKRDQSLMHFSTTSKALRKDKCKLVVRLLEPHAVAVKPSVAPPLLSAAPHTNNDDKNNDDDVIMMVPPTATKLTAGAPVVEKQMPKQQEEFLYVSKSVVIKSRKGYNYKPKKPQLAGAVLLGETTSNSSGDQLSW